MLTVLVCIICVKGSSYSCPAPCQVSLDRSYLLLLSLQEPRKDQLLDFRSGKLPSLPRQAFCILQTPPDFVVYEALVDLPCPNSQAPSAAAVSSWIKVGPAVVKTAWCLSCCGTSGTALKAASSTGPGRHHPGGQGAGGWGGGWT